MSGRSSSGVRVFAMPCLIGAATAVGLLAALLFEPYGRYVAWVTMALPIVTVIWAYLRKRASHV